MNQKKYWLRGGVYAEIIFILSVSILYVTGIIQVISYKVVCVMADCGPQTTIKFLNTSYNPIDSFIIWMFIWGVAIFILGAVIGLVYVNMKNKST